MTGLGIALKIPTNIQARHGWYLLKSTGALRPVKADPTRFHPRKYPLLHEAIPQNFWEFPKVKKTAESTASFHGFEMPTLFFCMFLILLFLNEQYVLILYYFSPFW